MSELEMKKKLILLLMVIHLATATKLKTASAHTVEKEKTRSHTEAEIYGYSGRKSRIHEIGDTLLDDDDWLLEDIIGGKPHSEDYGHFKFGKRQPKPQDEDYGYLRLGRNGGEVI